LNGYRETISELLDTYPITEGKNKKTQEFKYTKTKDEVTYINPVSNKREKLAESKAQPIIEYYKYLQDFEDNLKKSIKDINLLDYLAQNIILTHDIVKIDVLIKNFPSVGPEYYSKFLNTLLPEASTDDENVNMTDDQFEGYIAENDELPLIPEYMLLFNAIKKLSLKQLPATVKMLYKLRRGILNHPKCTSDFKKETLHSRLNIIRSSNGNISF